MRRSLLLLIALAALVAAPARAHVWFSATLDTEQAAGADYGSVDFYYFQHSTHVYFQVNTTDVLELTSLALVQEDESTGNLTVGACGVGKAAVRTMRASLSALASVWTRLPSRAPSPHHPLLSATPFYSAQPPWLDPRPRV